MKLSPLQSRLAASFIASCLLLALYLALPPPHFALAVELEQTFPIFIEHLDLDVDLYAKSSSDAPAPSLADPAYEPEFSAFDRSIIGRAPVGVTALVNNGEASMNLLEGSTQVFVFPATEGSKRDSTRGSLELRDEEGISQEKQDDAQEPDEDHLLARRQSSRTVFISANTCQQPQPRSPSKTTTAPPQLTLYVSTSSTNQSPGPLADAKSQVFVPFTEGAVMYNFTTKGDVYLGVHAPNLTDTFSGIYNFKVAASTDELFHSYNDRDDADLIWVDSDSQGALLITHNLTASTDPEVEAKVMSTEPYVMFAHNKNDHSIDGLRFSYCGLQTYAQIAATKNGQFASMVTTGMTKRGQGNLPKQEFYFSGLNSSSNYLGILAQPANVSDGGNDLVGVGGGGHVFRATNFSTKSDHGNCAIILNLTFCDQVAYSVPSNPSFGNSTKLAQFYDEYASSIFDNFLKALAQIPCEAPSTQRYSLARGCDDCRDAYKNWLCSVTIPRCEDFSNDAPYLHPRAISQPFPNGDVLDAATLALYPNITAFNSSRNPLIDSGIRPGPYKEVLPCDDLCYNLVQSCPSSMQFGCPRPGEIGFESSYFRRGKSSDLPNGDVTCNYQGSAHVFSAAGREGASLWGSLIGFVVAGLGLILI
ncbi:stretch-activated Ca2+-permeable channel component-domain-containing protein [Podospora appendiculata]|uniref:Stretch-activated Ca2+-permeable channel component-domain-containing protein n=1 Tax=Podospora appendiculata TaxID=314037 RepID=A0AAE1CA09_9PEZI|nr:stretch-activated Ca2+-permeable channel component-domain-containing protein [Podospora appendiculata]